MKCIENISAVCLLASILGACAEGEERSFMASSLEVHSAMDSIGLSLYEGTGSLYEGCTCSRNILFGKDSHPDVYLGEDELEYYAYSPYDGNMEDDWTAFDIRDQRQIYLSSGRTSAQSPVIEPLFKAYFKEMEVDGARDSVILDDAVLTGQVNIRTLQMRPLERGRLVLHPQDGEKGGERRKRIILPLRDE